MNPDFKDVVKPLAIHAGFHYDERDCNFYSAGDESQWINRELFTFAQLVVEECIKTIDPSGDLTSMSEEAWRDQCCVMIRKRFGISNTTKGTHDHEQHR